MVKRIRPKEQYEQLVYEADPYYASLAQCLNCKRMYPIASTNSVTLCVDCLELEDAQHYKEEE